MPLSDNVIRLQRRSWLGRVCLVPSVFLGHYRLLRKYNNRRDSARSAFALTSILWR